MRIFIGLSVSPDIQKRIKEWREKHAYFDDIRWTADRNLHITLVAPWYPDDAQKIKDIIDKHFANSKPFVLKFQSIGFGPEKKPRMIWAKAALTPEIEDFRKELHAALGKDIPEWPFTPHVTLARFNPENFASFPDKEMLDVVDWEMKIEEFALFESRLLRKGAEYKVIRRKKISSSN